MSPRQDIPNPLTQQPKVHCYGNSAALCAECLTATPSNKDLPTINLDVAPVITPLQGQSQQGKKVNWDQKITIQLNESELIAVAALLLGYITRIHLKRPGKGIELERQSGCVFVKASAGKGRNYPLPLTSGGCFKLSCLILSQLQSYLNLDQGLLLASIRGAALLHKSS